MRIVLTILVIGLFVGCAAEMIDHQVPDAAIDAPSDAMGSGSGSGAELFEPSPKDGNLEVVVVSASLFVVLGPAGLVAARRRRQDPKQSLTGKPHFS